MSRRNYLPPAPDQPSQTAIASASAKADLISNAGAPDARRRTIQSYRCIRVVPFKMADSPDRHVGRDHDSDAPQRGRPSIAGVAARFDDLRAFTCG